MTNSGTPGQHYGYDDASQKRHASMSGAIGNCNVLICGGMGMGAYDSIKSYDIELIVTVVRNEKAVKLYIQDKLPNLMERLH